MKGKREAENNICMNFYKLKMFYKDLRKIGRKWQKLADNKGKERGRKYFIDQLFKKRQEAENGNKGKKRGRKYFKIQLTKRQKEAGRIRKWLKLTENKKKR